MSCRFLIVVIGPTGVGKTDLTLEIAEYFGIGIINADSRQLFAEIPIGTAAPSVQQMQRVRHYFVGEKHIGDYYSASVYEKEVMEMLSSMDDACNGIALLSGGSMMYIDAVCNGIDEMPDIDEKLRESLKTRLEKEGLPALCDELKSLDPVYWENVDKNNPRRILHALEVCYTTGKPYSSQRIGEKKKRPFEIIKIGLNRPREELFERINARVLKMMDDGMEDEARSVYDKRAENALNTVGYKELFSYFDGQIHFEEAVRQIQRNTRLYAKKQLTWYKRDAEIVWFYPDNLGEILDYINIRIKQTLNKYL